jgi:D-alanyl-lipoteichoic acid acyltransferase DltB (MBOAT superfamily)
MLLTSSAYLTFAAIVFLAYWLVSRYRLAGLAVILVANYFFYARWGLIYLALVPVASTIDFALGGALARCQGARTRRLLVSASVALNVGLILSLRTLPLVHSAWSWTLPLGLSFYAFQSMTYTIDIYRRLTQPAPNYLVYLCASSFFPTTLAGPITRLSTLWPQIDNAGRTLAPADGGHALFLIGLGAMKKFLIADFLADQLVNRVFDTPKLYSSAEVLAALYGYAFQLYYDFSGYTDIALGSALLIGIKLPPNFRRPYSAVNVADFWRRWHISFSNWLRDYIYFSLPGLRSRWKALAYLNLVVTMAIGGLWHGLNWTFLIWGLLHGLGLAAVRGWQAWRGRNPSPGLLARFGGRLLTFHFVLLAWIFFRSPTVEAARDFLAQLGSFTVSFANIGPGFVFVLAIAAVAHYLPERWYDRSLRLYSDAPFYVQAAALALLVVSIKAVAATGAVPFIYTRF